MRQLPQDMEVARRQEVATALLPEAVAEDEPKQVSRLMGAQQAPGVQEQVGRWMKDPVRKGVEMALLLVVLEPGHTV